MSNETAIGWTDFSSNPIKYRNIETGKAAWACVKKSAGCLNCYSEALALRWNKGQAFSRPNIDKVVPFVDDKELKRLATDPKLSGKRVFIGDMTDIFGSWVSDDFLDRLFAAFAWRQDVTFQLLTKRPERMAAWFRETFQFHRTDGGIGFHGRQERVFDAMQEDEYADPNNDADWMPDGSYKWPGWPLPNVWIGTSVENQAAADERIPHLLATPAVVRFLSCEPLLGPLNLFDCDDHTGKLTGVAAGIDWVIVGGESGPRHRPMNMDWLTDIVEQCRWAFVPVFVKQDSGQYPGKQGRIPDALYVQQFPETAVSA
jgi:protein gp37